MPIMSFGVVSRVGQWMICLKVWVKIPQQVGANVFGRIGQRNVMYRKNVALQCGCSIPAAEGLDSYAVGIAQLAHTQPPDLV